MHFLVHYFGLICSLFCGDSFSLSVIPCWSLLLFGVQRIQSLVIAWLVYSHLWSRWQVSQNLIYIYIYNLLNNLCFLIKSCQLMVTLWSLLSSLFHRQDICSSGNGPWNGAGAGIFTHLYLCLKDTTGHWSAIQNILRTFFCILTWVGRWWNFIFIWMQNCAGTSWIWLCNILFWAGRFVTTWLADQALGDYHEAY